MKYVIFHPDRPGFLLDEIIQDNIIAAAKRGKTTPDGEKLILVPDKKASSKGPDGSRSLARVRNSECMTLKRAFGHLKTA